MEQWKAAVRASGVVELIGFVDGLADDAEAVANGCTESWSNGMVEGYITKVKWIKRGSYGQAGFPLLQRRVEARILLPEKHLAWRKRSLLNMQIPTIPGSCANSLLLSRDRNACRNACETVLCYTPIKSSKRKGESMEAVRKEKATELQTETTSTEVRLRGRVLIIARAVWLASALFELILFSINLLQPLFGGQTLICPLTFTCPYDTPTLQALGQAQIALTAYTIYVTAFGLLFALVFVGLSVLLFWRMFDQLVGLLASFAFLLLGCVGLVGDLSSMPLALQVFVGAIQTEIMLLCLGFFLVTFPDGRFVPRWSWLIGCTLFVQGIFFQIPGPFNILSWPLPLFLLKLVLAFGSPVALQIYRYRRVSTPAQRQQTKWVIFGLTCAILLFLLAVFPTIGALGPLVYLASASLSSFAFLLIPSSVTMAILRSRLWDIDVLINRTLVYGLLTATLLVVYLALVFAGQTLLSSLLGQNNGVVLVGSTLIVAALFQPLRRRIQQLIDRRFYRRKYDAQKTLAAFSSTLRGEVDLDQVREQLLAVVQETMQPASLSLWIRPVKHEIASGGTSGESLSRAGEWSSADRSDSR